MFFNTYPYTDGHELNLDWILAKIRELQKEMADFEVINAITFSGEWNIADQYPAWTIVTDNNIGYVSIRPVPAGVPLTNTDYWRVVIDYTAQIAGLQNRVVTLEGEMDVAQGDITTLQSDVLNLSNQINHRYIIVGDSYEGTSHFARKTIEYLGLDANFTSLDSYLEVNGDKTAYILSYGGMGFTNIGLGPDQNVNGFLKMLQTSGGLVDDPDTITDLVVLAGANDSFWDLMDPYVEIHMNDFADYAETIFPNVKLWDGFIARVRKNNPSNIQINQLLNCFYFFSNANRYTYMHGVEYSLYIYDGLISSDNIHPTTDGGRNIARNAACILKGGNPVATWSAFNFMTTATFDSSVGSSGTGLSFAASIFDGLHFHIDLPVFNWMPNSAVNGEFDITIATHDKFYLNKPVSYNIPTFAMQSGVGIYPIACSIIFDEYDIKIKGMIPESSTSWHSHNLIAMLFEQISIDIPLAYC